MILEAVARVDTQAAADLRTNVGRRESDTAVAFRVNPPYSLGEGTLSALRSDGSVEHQGGADAAHRGAASMGTHRRWSKKKALHVLWAFSTPRAGSHVLIICKGAT